ncbi:PGF-pre-PGF domain-containing protein [Methanosarcina sp. KYL-1]|uniref:PGF-pre-PGF domain-containing protein n=1 Tax=Methanosarcina sp. KYL-1 TaxID=2602068 RepID=UPI0021017F03|nr:PGF-pre-PGF domain-containing protein [Methanosarcina sp. KYL-1]MCQ1535799.1 PGF-pre-PGF domain-containing protein [Methanosarcina sp. KYL-1]
MKIKILLLLIVLMISARAVSASDIGVGANPGSLSFKLAPGASAEQSLYVINTGSETATYELYLDDTTYASWFTLSPSSFDLKAKENKMVKVALRVPPSAEGDADCKIKILCSVSGGIVGAGARIPVHIDVSASGESPSGLGGSSSGGSSSGGGGGGSPEPANNVETKELSQQFVTNGKHIRFEFKQEATSVGYVEFDAKKTAGKITIIVEELKGRSVLTPEGPEGEVFQYLNIWAGNEGFATSENIGSPVVGFRVSREWLTDNNIDVSSIALQHFNDEQWNLLPTKKVNEDDEYIYFEAETPGFSPFAITGEKIGKTAGNSDITPVKRHGEEALNSSIGSESTDRNSGTLPGFDALLAGAGLAISGLLIRRRSFN